MIYCAERNLICQKLWVMFSSKGCRQDADGPDNYRQDEDIPQGHWLAIDDEKSEIRDG